MYSSIKPGFHCTMSRRVELNILFNSQVTCYRNFLTYILNIRNATVQWKAGLLLCRVPYTYLTFGIRLSNLSLGYERTSFLRRTLFLGYYVILYSQKRGGKGGYGNSDFRVRGIIHQQQVFVGHSVLKSVVI